MMTKFLILLFLWSSSSHTKTPDQAPRGEAKLLDDPTLNFNSNAKQAIITDFYTGKILFEKNADELMHPSSMTKLMTAYMAFDRLKKDVKADTPVHISNKAWRMGGSRMFVDVNSYVPFMDLLKGGIIVSGNDACVAIAEHLAGSEEVFAAQMTKKARDMGCTHTTFRNASGWPDPEHLTTARDLAIILKRLIEDFPEHLALFSIPEYTYNNITQQNRHPLFDKNIGCDVGKTGFTDAGQYGLAASAHAIDHEGHKKRINMVINGLASAKERAHTSMSHLVWALKNFSTKPIAQKNQIMTSIKIKDGVEQKVSLSPVKDVYVTIPNLSSDDIKTEFEFEPTVLAPIKAGQVLGKAVISAPTYAEPIIIDLVATKDIARASMLKRMLNAMTNIFKREA